MANQKFRFSRRMFKNNTHRRLALKRAHRKVNLRRQAFQNREIYLSMDGMTDSVESNVVVD